MRDESEAIVHDIEWMIVNHGWAVVAVGPDGDAPGFAYTVGLHDKGAPELFVSALPPQVVQPLLNDAARRHLESQFPPGEPVLDLVEGGYAMIPVEMDSGPLHVARALQEGDVRALQLVYPDAERRFPWDEGYSMTVQKFYGSMG